METKIISTRVPVSLSDALDRRVKAGDQTKAQIVVEALTAFLDGTPRKEPEKVEPDGAKNPEKAKELLAEADRLVKIQQDERGYKKGKDLEGKPTLILEPYVPTPEREQRAQRIIALRKQAAVEEFGEAG